MNTNVAALLTFIIVIVSGNSYSQVKTSSAEVVNRTVKHSLTPAQLSKLGGTMFWDKNTKGLLSPALKELLGNQWPDFDKAFSTTTPLVFKDGKLVGSGFKEMYDAAIEFNSNGKTIAALKIGDKCIDFGPVNPGYLCDEIDR